MSLKERLRASTAPAVDDLRKRLFGEFGIVKNPYPVAGEPSGHPHSEIPVEEEIIRAVEVFDRDHTSQVLLVEGTQGVGKTNLLNYFQSELENLYEGSQGFYIIRYYPDPESTFDGIIKRLFQEFHEENLLANLGKYLHDRTEDERETTLETAHSHEVRLMLTSLVKAAPNEAELADVAELAFEWLSGMRLLNKHREALHVHFRLDSVESKTQALRDIVLCSSSCGLLKGMFLLLDELEKQDYSVSKTVVLRYLSAVRALIDALPNHLFMLIAITPAARTRYFSMLPAFAGRLQNVVRLQPLTTDAEALPLFQFYTDTARTRAIEEVGTAFGTPGRKALLSNADVQDLFRLLLRRAAAEKAQEGVTQRDFLNALHKAAEEKIGQLKQ